MPSGLRRRVCARTCGTSTRRSSSPAARALVLQLQAGLDLGDEGVPLFVFDVLVEAFCVCFESAELDQLADEVRAVCTRRGEVVADRCREGVVVLDFGEFVPPFEPGQVMLFGGPAIGGQV